MQKNIEYKKKECGKRHKEKACKMNNYPKTDEMEKKFGVNEIFSNTSTRFNIIKTCHKKIKNEHKTT